MMNCSTWLPQVRNKHKEGEVTQQQQSVENSIEIDLSYEDEDVSRDGQNKEQDYTDEPRLLDSVVFGSSAENSLEKDEEKHQEVGNTSFTVVLDDDKSDSADNDSSKAPDDASKILSDNEDDISHGEIEDIYADLSRDERSLIQWSKDDKEDEDDEDEDDEKMTKMKMKKMKKRKKMTKMNKMIRNIKPMRMRLRYNFLMIKSFLCMSMSMN